MRCKRQIPMPSQVSHVSSPLKTALMLAVAALALGACAAIPDVGPRAQAKPPTAYEAEQSFAAPTADWPSDRWWDAYGDAQLSGLIDEALKGSPTLKQAEARLRSSEALAQQARAGTLPSLAANGQVGYTETSREQGFPAFIQDLLPKGYQGTGRLSLDAAYDLDLFGKNRAALSSAVSEAAATRADLAQARLTLSTAVAQAYGNLIGLSAERDAAAEAVRTRAETSRLTSDRVRNGLDTQGELKQAQAATPTSQADVDSLDEQILIARHRIAALLGDGPDRGLAITAPKPGAIKPFGLPANLTVNLVGRRPDLVAARLRAQAAAKRIEVAEAGFYPDITLSAYIGQQSLGLGQLFNPAAAIGSIGPAISLPIFQGGRLRGAYRGARADYDAAVASYDQTLTQALQDVADAAASAQSQQRQLAERREAVTAGEAAYSIAKMRYQGGLSSYVAVLSAEDAIITQRRALADAQARAFLLDVALVRALGGGFTDS
jgi:NodT family efflux transporter outer membrane factor (OMF) lipoprotein